MTLKNQNMRTAVLFLHYGKLKTDRDGLFCGSPLSRTRKPCAPYRRHRRANVLGDL
jgi:hypothetical protein